MCDGIDEYFDVVLPRTIKRLNRQLPADSLHLHCTDGDGEWMVKVDNGELHMTHEHAKAAVAWRGSALDLFLTCWGRSQPTLEVLGDPSISQQWSCVAP
jgi:predicted lipid carrier protein YhbT